MLFRSPPRKRWEDGTPATSAKIYTMYRKDKGTCTAPFATEIVSAPDRAFVKWDGTTKSNASLNGGQAFTYDSMLPFIDTENVVNLYAVYEDVEYNPDAGKTLKIYWAIDNLDGAEWTTYGNGNAWTETIAWSDKDNTFMIPGLTVKDGYKLAGWSVSGKDANYWDAGTKTFGLKGLIVEDENGGSVAITANIVKDEPPVDPDAGKTLKIYWAIDNPAGAEWTTYGNGNAWTETIAWSDKDNTFMIPGLTVKDGYKLAGWSVSGKDANYWDAGTKTFGLKGLIVEDENGGYVSITANIVKDETPEDNNGSGGGGTTHTYKIGRASCRERV